MIKIENLNYSYDKKNIILENINLSFEENKIYFLLGKNGSGKSTLIKCILNILNDYEGNIFIDSKNLKTMSRKEISKYLSYVPQEHYPLFNYNVLDVAAMAMANSLKFYEYPNKKDMDRVKEVFSYLNILHLSSKGYSELSGGERQLILIARAILQNSKIILMDEPTSNLDYGNKIRLMQTLNRLKRDGYTIIISSHDPQDAIFYGDITVLFHEKKILKYGATTDIINSENLTKIYGQDIEVIHIHEKEVAISIPRLTKEF